MGLSVLIVIIASVLLGVILGAILTRPRRWDLHICADDTDRPAGPTGTGADPEDKDQGRAEDRTGTEDVRRESRQLAR